MQWCTATLAFIASHTESLQYRLPDSLDYSFHGMLFRIIDNYHTY